MARGAGVRAARVGFYTRVAFSILFKLLGLGSMCGSQAGFSVIALSLISGHTFYYTAFLALRL